MFSFIIRRFALFWLRWGTLEKLIACSMSKHINTLACLCTECGKILAVPVTLKNNSFQTRMAQTFDLISIWSVPDISNSRNGAWLMSRSLFQKRSCLSQNRTLILLVKWILTTLSSYWSRPGLKPISHTSTKYRKYVLHWR